MKRRSTAGGTNNIRVADVLVFNFLSSSYGHDSIIKSHIDEDIGYSLFHPEFYIDRTDRPETKNKKIQ